ncbi:MAG: phosphoribosylanthranilate isomerase [Phycisphaerae bacterium]|nr:phosphoribosylanthranilate isomerase [Phycisphaerae bacterium]
MTPRRTRVKICGLSTDADVVAAAEAGADLVGFVLWQGSPRHVTLERARALAALAARHSLESVALVVDAEPAFLAALGDFDRVQCHGHESCNAVSRAPKPVLRGFPFSPEAFATWAACPSVDALLVDGPRGGSGEAFDHAPLVPLVAASPKKVFLAGGLTPETVGAAIARVRPYGVDVSSGVERTRGVKDPERMAAFCAAVRMADALSA